MQRGHRDGKTKQNVHDAHPDLGDDEGAAQLGQPSHSPDPLNPKRQNSVAAEQDEAIEPMKDMHSHQTFQGRDHPLAVAGREIQTRQPGVMTRNPTAEDHLGEKRNRSHPHERLRTRRQFEMCLADSKVFGQIPGYPEQNQAEEISENEMYTHGPRRQGEQYRQSSEHDLNRQNHPGEDQASANSRLPANAQGQDRQPQRNQKGEYPVAPLECDFQIETGDHFAIAERPIGAGQARVVGPDQSADNDQTKGQSR